MADDEHTGRDVDDAPSPGDESGRIDDGDGGDSTLRKAGRGLLAVPRATFEIASAPLRLGAWAYDRYKLRDRWFAVFFNDDRTVGLYPTLSVDYDLDTRIGGRFVARDLFGEHESVSVRGAWGGTYSTSATAAVSSGERFAPFALQLGAEHLRRPHDRYYGIGNADDAVETRYRQQTVRSSLVADLEILPSLHVRTSGALASHEYGPGESGMATPDVYMPVGFDGVRTLYGETELVLDTRRASSPWEIDPVASAGGLVAIYAGRVVVADRRDFWRVGGDFQHFLRLGKGPRVLATRLHAEGVSGSADEVPFDELPELGGKDLLRGYDTDRFRDRCSALATAEYRWDLSKYIIAKTFVDAGRVAPEVATLADGDLHVGYGIGLEAYSERQFVMRASLASSIDGGVFFNVAFDPGFELDPRVRRR